YTWIESNEPDGPAFNWFEISGIGQNTGLTGDDQTVALALPFAFNFYGLDYTTVNVSSNGNIHFGTANSYYYNQCLPDLNGPAAMIAPFWDDLYLPSGGAVYYYDDAANGRFVIEWSAVPHIGSTGDLYTFQVMLYSNGRIVVQYLSMGGGSIGVIDATVGLQNGDYSTALEVVCNAAYVTDNLAVLFEGVPQWMSLTGTLTGILETSQCATVNLNFDAENLTSGEYTGELIINSNDTDETPLIVPVTFIVGTLDAPLDVTLFYLSGSNELQLRWQAVNGATSYTVYSDIIPGGTFETVVGNSPTNSLTIPFPGTNRLFYLVKANN
ncbi:MAG: nidogen-like domain-containing protein, partial [Calditrichota bacterium]